MSVLMPTGRNRFSIPVVLLLVVQALFCLKTYTGVKFPPNEFILIPPGLFYMGCVVERDPACRADETPGRYIFVDRYWIQTREVSISEYEECVRSGVCSSPRSGGDCNWGRRGFSRHPANCVDWIQAATYCATIGGKLPTEDQWEKAARGAASSAPPPIYPWGDEMPDCRRVVHNDGQSGCGRHSTWETGSEFRSGSRFGVLHMSGNVEEWTRDEYRTVGNAAIYRGVRGGSWRDGYPEAFRISNRSWSSSGSQLASLGFRCVKAGSSTSPD